VFERAVDLAHLLRLLDEHPDAVLVAGSTDWGVDVNLRGARAPFVIGIDRVPELRGLSVADAAEGAAADGGAFVEIGAALTLSEVERGLGGRVPLLDQLLPQFASRLIRNGATLGGNLATASPIGDAAPALLALDAVVVLTSTAGDREVPLSEYFTGYRQTVRRPGEVIRCVRIPLPLSALTAFHKVAKRRFDDISSVAAAIALEVDDGVVVRARVGLGGVAATPLRARGTEAALEGRPWSPETVRAAADVLGREGTPIDDHRASAAYRSAMLRTALPRLYARTTTQPSPAVTT
jgi:xanthine dehydrogenase small subunit